MGVMVQSFASLRPFWRGIFESLAEVDFFSGISDFWDERLDEWREGNVHHFLQTNLGMI